MRFFVKAVASGFAMALGSALFKKVSNKMGLDPDEAKATEAKAAKAKEAQNTDEEGSESDNESSKDPASGDDEQNQDAPDEPENIGS